MATTRARLARPLVLVALCLLAAQTGSAFQGQTVSYTMYTPDGRRTAVVRTGITPETIALEQLASTFSLTFTEDRAANGIIIGTKGERIYASPGQSFVRAAGRVVALDGPVQRDRGGWTVPIDFLTKALGPAIGQPVVVRRASRLVLVGTVRVPEIKSHVERTGSGARVVITIQPATLHRVTREGAHLTIHFDATALDAAAPTGLIPDFAPGIRVDGTNLVIDLGPQAAAHRAEDDRATGALTIDLLPPQPPAPPPGPARPAPAPPPAPKLDLQPAGLRTIVLDPGHGGDDAGETGAGGTKEKDITLIVARRLKAAIEGRLGLRVLLTREGDDTVSMDRRTEIANNNKADAFISLHANGSIRPGVRGTQIFTPFVTAAGGTGTDANARLPTVPVVGGGSRVIESVPWDVAQRPFVDQSTSLGAVLARQLAEHNVPLFARPAVQAPMRVLTSAHMPAVLLELAFLSNADDEKLLANSDWQSSVIEGVLAALGEIRRGIPAGPAAGDRR